MKLLPSLSRPLRPPGPRPPSGLLAATALELAVLAGHLAAYPFGLTPERRTAPRPPVRPAS
ncbi:lipase, partial [Streptomyces griseus]|nr:lipase [Streptomyces griseus]